MPKAVIDSAKRKLAELERLDVVNANNERSNANADRQSSKPADKALTSKKHQLTSNVTNETQLSMAFDHQEHWLEQKIKQIDIDDLSPREALALLYQWRKEVK